MNKLIFFSLLLYIIFLSCSKSQRESTSIENDISGNTLYENKDQEIINPSDSGIVKIYLNNGKGSVQTRKKENQTIYIEFLVDGYTHLSAHLSSPDSLANIRFSQIFIPDSTMDGPFGKDFEYDLSDDGLYKISVHENMMAGDPWSGEFEVQIKLR